MSDIGLRVLCFGRQSGIDVNIKPKNRGDAQIKLSEQGACKLFWNSSPNNPS